MENFNKIISIMSAGILAISNITAFSSMATSTEMPMDFISEEENETISKEIDFNQTVLNKFFDILKLPQDVSTWTETEKEKWNFYKPFYNSLIEISKSTTRQQVYESFCVLIGYPIDSSQWTNEQNIGWENNYKDLYILLAEQLPKELPVIESQETTIEFEVNPVVTEVTTDWDLTGYETVTTAVLLDTYVITQTSELINSTTTTSNFISTTETTAITTENTSTTATTSVTSTTSTITTTAATSISSATIGNSEVPQTLDKGIFWEILSLVFSIFALAASIIANKKKN